MDHPEYNTLLPPRERGQHLRFEDRCEIRALKRAGYSNRKIAQQVNCSPSTVANELKRGTASNVGKRGRPYEYSPRRGQAVYNEHRKNSHRPYKLEQDSRFFRWVRERVLSSEKWSLDVCAGTAKERNLFSPAEMVCTRSLYRALWNGRLELTPFDLPEALSRKRHRVSRPRNRRVYGRSIDERPTEVLSGQEFGHWEIDTVVGKRAGREAVVLTLVEKQSRYLIAMRLSGKNSDAVSTAMDRLRQEYSEHFPEVFRSITSDNGAEFSELSKLEEHGTGVYFAHPYSSWERPQNERANRMLRRYLPKGKSMAGFSFEQIEWFADSLNGLPRRILNYRTSAELFDTALDQIYRIDSTVA